MIRMNDDNISGGALLAKYSYKKLSQNDPAEFIPDEECGEYKTPIIKSTGRVSQTHDHENTDDKMTEQSPVNTSTCTETPEIETCPETPEDTCDDSGISCSDVMTQSDILPDYNFTVQFPATLREEDYDWGGFE